MSLSPKTFSQLITFARSTTGTRVNASGLIETIAANQPRFDFDPTTASALGILLEEARTNLLLYSEQFDNAVWSANNCSITPNSRNSPYGTATADLVVPNTSNALHDISQNPTLANSTSYTFSLFALHAGYDWIIIEFYDGVAFRYASIDVNTGALGPVDAALTVPAPYLVNGMWRFSVTGTTASTGTPRFTIFIQNSSTAAAYAGDGTSGIYLWGAQLEQGSFATSYMPTASATFTRTADSGTVPVANIPDFSATIGTLVVAFSMPHIDANAAHIGAAFSSDSTHWIGCDLEAGGVPRAIIFNTTVQADDTFAAVTAGTVVKMAIAYSSTQMRSACNGVLGSALHSVASLPTVTELDIGSVFGFDILDGHVKSVTYYPGFLTDAELQQVTTP